MKKILMLAMVLGLLLYSGICSAYKDEFPTWSEEEAYEESFRKEIATKSDSWIKNRYDELCKKIGKFTPVDPDGTGYWGLLWKEEVEYKVLLDEPVRRSEKRRIAEEKKQHERLKAQRKLEQEAKERKIASYPPTIQTAIKNHKVVLGMTAEQAELAWGKPNNINRTITKWGVHEQWVYGGHSYLYFEDGILTAIQN